MALKKTTFTDIQKKTRTDVGVNNVDVPLLSDLDVNQIPKVQGPISSGSQATSPEVTANTSQPTPISTNQVNDSIKVFRNEQGNLSGVEVNGKTFLGLRPEEVTDVVNQEVSKRTTPTGAVEFQDLQKQEELANLAAEEAPTQRSLAPQDLVVGGVNISKIPVIGAGIASGVELLGNAAAKGWIPGFEGRTTVQSEELRTKALTEVERQTIEEGVSASESFGALIEAIPGIGSLVSKYANGLIETPSGNVQTITSTIASERARADRMARYANQGLITPEVAQKNIEDIELNIQRMESRLKVLINASPRLRYDSDQVNKIEVEILRSRDAVLAAKIRAAQGKNQELADQAIYSALEDYNNE